MKLSKANIMWGFPCYGGIPIDNAICSDRLLIYCARRGINYLLVNNQTPVKDLIANYLRQRGLVR